jgi:hypothetical protein
VRKIAWLALCVFALAGVSQAQSPSDGTVRNNVYRNTFFKIEFALPSGLQAVDFSKLKLPPSNGREFGLMSAKEGNDPYGMILIAETLGTGKGYFRDEEDFLGRVRVSQGLDASQKTVALPSRVGPTFKELYFTSGDELNAAVILLLDGHLLVWRCNARTQAELNVMLGAIHSLHKIG